MFFYLHVYICIYVYLRDIYIYYSYTLVFQIPSEKVFEPSKSQA